MFIRLATNVTKESRNEEKLKLFWLKKLNPSLVKKSFASLKHNVDVNLKKRENGFKAFIYA